MDIRKIVYRGWKESVELVNDTVRVVIAPQIGRIMHYGFKGDQNFIWVNPAWEGKFLADASGNPEKSDAEWANFGGDKVWPVEQFRWPEVNGRSWPPDPWFDGSPHAVEMIPGGVRMTSPVSRFCGARLIREIRLADSGPRVSIHQILEKIHPARNSAVEPLPMTIWSVTQVIEPEEILVPLNPQSCLSEQVHIFDDNPETRSHFIRDKGVGIFKPSDSEHQKIGTDGDRWVAAIFGEKVFCQLFRREVGAVHPEGDLSVEVYTSPEHYTELEVLSPLRTVKPGETVSWIVEWMLHAMPNNTDKDSRRGEAFLWLEQIENILSEK